MPTPPEPNRAHEKLTAWMEGHIATLHMFNHPNRFGELLQKLPPEIQMRIFSFLAITFSKENQGAATLHAAALVNRHWRSLAEEPKLWFQCRPIITAKTTAEELVAALQSKRFSQVNSSNFRIKNCPQLARSDIQFGLQTRVEMLEGLDMEVLVKARWVLRTPGGKVALHDRMRRGVNKKNVIRLNILSGMAPPCEARRLRGGFCISAMRNQTQSDEL